MNPNKKINSDEINVSNIPARCTEGFEREFPVFNDNYAKTIGLYNYLKEERGIARAEIIRKEDNRFLRLNLGDSMIQHDVMNMHSDDVLNQSFRKHNP